MISVILPYMRDDGAKRCMDALIDGNQDFHDYEIVCGKDEKRIGCPKMVKMLTDGTKYDLVMFLQDDSIPQKDILKHAYDKMQEFEGGWGLVSLNDLSGRGRFLATHWLAHKKLLEPLEGEFLHTGYKHCFSDNEISEHCIYLNRFKYAPEAMVIHNHPITTGNKSLNDDDYNRIYSQEYMMHDKKLYIQRKANNWKS